MGFIQALFLKGTECAEWRPLAVIGGTYCKVVSFVLHSTQTQPKPAYIIKNVYMAEAIKISCSRLGFR